MSSTTLTAESTQVTEEVPQTNPWSMAGTENTSEYVVLAESSFGRIGYRILPGIPGFTPDAVRIRLEPATEAHAAKIAEHLSRNNGWKQPGDSGQNRFSTVVLMGTEAIETLETAYALIKRGRPLVYNPAKPDYKSDLQSL